MQNALKDLFVESEAKKSERMTKKFVHKVMSLDLSYQIDHSKWYSTVHTIPQLLKSAFEMLNSSDGKYISEDVVCGRENQREKYLIKKHKMRYNKVLKLIIEYGGLEHVQLMLQRFPKLRTQGNMTAQFMFAVAEGKLPIVQYLLADINLLIRRNRAKNGHLYIEYAKYMRNFCFYSMKVALEYHEFSVALYIEDYFRERFNTVQDDLELSDKYRLYHFLATRFVSKFSMGFVDVMDMMLHVLLNKDKVAPLFCVSKSWSKSLDSIVPECADISRIVLSFIMFGNDFSFSSIHALQFAALPKFVRCFASNQSKYDIYSMIEQECKKSEELGSTILAKLPDTNKKELFNPGSKQWLYIFEFIANPNQGNCINS